MLLETTQLEKESVLRWGPPFPLVKTHFSKEKHAFRKKSQNLDFLWCSVFSAQARRRQLAKMRVSLCCRGGPFSLGEIALACSESAFAKARTWTFASTRWPARAAAARTASERVGQSRQPTGQTAFWPARWLAGPLARQPAGQPDASKAFRKEIWGSFHNFAREFLTNFWNFLQEVASGKRIRFDRSFRVPRARWKRLRTGRSFWQFWRFAYVPRFGLVKQP